MNKLLNNLLGMYKQAKLNKKVEEKESAKKDYNEMFSQAVLSDKQFKELANSAKDMGDEIWGILDGKIVHIIAIISNENKVLYIEPYYGEEETKETYENADEAFDADFFTLELLPGDDTYADIGFVAKESSKNKKLTKKAKIVLEQINNEYFLNGKKGDYSDFNNDGKYKQISYNIFVDKDGKTHKVWEFAGTLDKQTTKKKATIVEKYKNDFSGYTDTYQLETIEKNLNQYDIDDIKSELSEAKRFVSKMDKLKRMPHKDVGNYYYMKDKALIAEKLIEEKTKNKMGKSATIKHENGVYNVYSESGKCLGKGYKTKEEAEKRLKQVEYFKNKKAEWKYRKPKQPKLYEEWCVTTIDDDMEDKWFKSEYAATQYFNKIKNKVKQFFHKVYDLSNGEPEEIQVDVLYDRDEDYSLEENASKQTKNKRTSLKQVVISKMAGNYYTNKKEELLNIAKDYKVGIVDGQIMTPERAVRALINHTNIGYIQFSNDEELLNYDSLTDAIYESGIDYELSDKYYID